VQGFKVVFLNNKYIYTSSSVARDVVMQVTAKYFEI